jgi:hypothetical protein
MMSWLDHNLRERDPFAAYGGSIFRLVSDLSDPDSHYLSMDVGVESAISSRFRADFKEMFRDGQYMRLPHSLVESNDTFKL